MLYRNHIYIVKRLGARRNNVQYAFAVFEGVVKEVYKIKSWQQAPNAKFKTNIHYQNRPKKVLEDERRWVFAGGVAEEKVRSQYKDKSVKAYSPVGNRNPIKYVNVKR